MSIKTTKTHDYPRLNKLLDTLETNATTLWLALITVTLLDTLTTITALLGRNLGVLSSIPYESNGFISVWLSKVNYHACMNLVSCRYDGSGKHVGTEWFGMHAADILAASSLLGLAALSVLIVYTISRITPRPYHMIPVVIFITARLAAGTHNALLFA